MARDPHPLQMPDLLLKENDFPFKYVLATPQLPCTWAVAMSWAAPYSFQAPPGWLPRASGLKQPTRALSTVRHPPKNLELECVCCIAKSLVSVHSP